MKKAAVILIILLISLSFLSAENVYLRLAMVEGDEHPHARACEYFARIANRSSEGSINIRLYPDSELGTAARSTEQLEFGGIQLSLIDLKQLPGVIQGMNNILSSFDLTDRSTAMASFELYREDIEKLLEDNGITLLSVFSPKLSCFYSLKHNFFSPADFSGLTIGVGESSWMRAVLESHGVTTRVAVEKDIITALSNLYIDAAVDSFIDLCLSSRYAFSNCISITETGTLPTLLLINTKVLESLSAEEQLIVRNAARRAAYYADSLLERAEEEWLERAMGEKIFCYLENMDEA